MTVDDMPAAGGEDRPLPSVDGSEVRGLLHLLAMVQGHDAEHGVPEAPGCLIVGWEADSGWWLSIVCPGHYAFEQDGRGDITALVQEACDYYSSGKAFYDSGCREHHPVSL